MKNFIKGLSLGLIFCLAGGTAWARSDLGMNLTWPTDWAPDHPFADIIKTSRTWCQINAWDNTVSANTQGWPLEDAQLFLWANLNMQGSYHLSFTGQADIGLGGNGWDANPIRNLHYDSGTNQTIADLVYVSSAVNNVWITFQNTTGGVRNVKLMRPRTLGSALSYPETAFLTDEFKAAVAPFSTLRYMHFMATVGSNQTSWSDRMPPYSYSYNIRDAANANGLGASWECVIQISNESQKDAWICVPFLADDTYILNLARVFRYGSDANGVPYTSTQANPAYPPLNENLKLYIEFSNEVWNYAQNENRSLAVAEVLDQGDPNHINYDNLTYSEAYSGWLWGWRRPGAKLVQISKVFRQVFGDSQMMARIRPMLCWQAVRHATAWAPLEYIEHTQTQPVSYYVYGGGGAAYYDIGSNVTGLTLDNIWDRGSMNVDWWRDTWPDGQDKRSMLFNSYICNNYGIKEIAYEGGPSFDTTGYTAADTVLEQATTDSRITNNIIAHHNAYTGWGGEMLMYFVLGQGSYQWNFLNNIFDSSHPKYQAMTTLNATTMIPLAVGNPVGLTLDGNVFQLGDGDWRDVGDSRIGTAWRHNKAWVSYQYYIPAAGFYEAVANITSGTGDTWTVSWWMDGQQYPAATLAAETAADVTSSVFNLSPGLHSLRVNADHASGADGWIINSITMRATNVTDNQVPTAPTNLAATPVSASQVALAWTVSTDDVGVAGYRVYRDGVLIATVVYPSYIDNGLTRLTAYTYTVRAFDVVGKEGLLSAPVITTTLVTSHPVSSDKIIVFPNPCKVKANPVLYFINLPAESTIRIYNLTGELVAKMEGVANQTGWNLSGIAAGVYIYSVKYPSGQQKGKVCVQR